VRPDGVQDAARRRQPGQPLDARTDMPKHFEKAAPHADDLQHLLRGAGVFSEKLFMLVHALGALGKLGLYRRHAPAHAAIFFAPVWNWFVLVCHFSGVKKPLDAVG